MKFPQRGGHGGLKFNLTPMIDVVFNLIIFFLAASHIARTTHQDQVRLPAASQGREDRDDDAHRVEVTIGVDHQLSISGERVTSLQFERSLHEKRRAAQSASRSVELRIRADETVPYRHIEPLLTTAARVGVTKIKFAVRTSDPEDSATPSAQP